MNNSGYIFSRLTFIFVVFLLFSNLYGQIISFEGVADKTEASQVYSFIDSNGDSTSLISVISNIQSNRGVGSLFLNDLSDESKPIVSIPLVEEGSTFGTVSLSCFVPSGNNKSVYIAITNGTSSTARFLELKIKNNGEILYENGPSDPSITTISLNDWHHFQISWVNHRYSIVMGGEPVLINQTSIDESITPTMLLLYAGDNASVSSKVFFDDIYSDQFEDLTF